MANVFCRYRRFGAPPRRDASKPRRKVWLITRVSDVFWRRASSLSSSIKSSSMRTVLRMHGIMASPVEVSNHHPDAARGGSAG